MRTRVTLFLILAVALGTAHSQPTSPTSPTTLGLSSQTAARALPFRGELEGTYTAAGEPPLVSVRLEAKGEATRVGQFTMDFRHVVNFADLTGTGTAHLTAANGDKLTTDVIGFATPLETPGAFFIMEVHTIVGGTGRFEESSGSFTVVRATTPTSAVSGVTSGFLIGAISIRH
jgi:hypothetical protein